ncbi:hypothetical protein Tco_0725954 [Tanacetum coccineum]|uniref:Reverse transcriptase domain-containing protein n=1 Tax=Tanacetum coccineum TaxID=301880 RepID=A0ABQ4YFT2_9ASTR
MILELADRTISTPTGIAEDVFVKVGTFFFPADFVVVDYVADPMGSPNLRKTFLEDTRALIDEVISNGRDRAFLEHDIQYHQVLNRHIYDSEGDTVHPEELSYVIKVDPNLPRVTGWRVCIDYRKLNDATRKDHFQLPFMDQMLERLAGNEYYCFLDRFSGYFQILIDPLDQEKTTFT